MEWNGLDAELTFFKGTLDKLGIKPEIFKVGDFKSAVEPFIRENMSDPNRLQVKSFLGSINNHMVAKIAQSRGLRTDSLQRYADNLTIQTPTDALNRRLISNIGYQDEVEALIKKQLGLADKKKVEYVSLGKYSDAESTDNDDNSSKNRIAVIIASGDINSGKSDDNSIGSEVKAIVLRVNSGGGSALASDVMQREVDLARKAKPVIGSMSDYAASGGYYMLMGCTKIMAQPNTITGSIGVFSLLFNTENFFKDKLGVTYDRVLTNANAEPSWKFSDTAEGSPENRSAQVSCEFSGTRIGSRLSTRAGKAV